MVESPRQPRRPPVRAGLLLLALLAVAFATRRLRCDEGLPYLHFWDEPYVAATALNMLETGDWNPHLFNYGSLTFYLYGGVEALHFLYLKSIPLDQPGAISSFDDIQTPTDSNWMWTISHPSFYLWCRIATALIGVASIFLTYRIARMFAGPWTALLAAAILAGTKLHVDETVQVGPEVPGMCLGLLSLYLSLRYLERGVGALLVIAFALVGFAASFKYNHALMALAPALAAALRAFRAPDDPRGWIAGVAWIACPLAFIAGTPWCLLDTRTFLEQVGVLFRLYAVPISGEHVVQPGLANLGRQVKFATEGVGVPFLALAALGLPLLFARGRWIATVLVVFAVVYTAFMARTCIDFHHNYLPLYPVMSVAAAVGAAWLQAGIARANAAAGRLFVAGIAALALVSLGKELAHAVEVSRTPETRSQAIDAVNRLAAERGWRKVGVAAELHVHELDLERLEVEAEVAPLLRLAALARNGGDLDALVSARRYTGRSSPGGPNAQRIRDLNAVVDGEILAEIPGCAKFITEMIADPGVVVFVPPPRADAEAPSR